jgi:hypothetical protein
MGADEYEAAFHGIELPESVELFPGSKIPDVRLFLEKEFEILRKGQSTRVVDAVKYRLDRLLAIINEKNEGDNYI